MNYSASAVADQTINPGESVVFTVVDQTGRGLVRPSVGNSSFVLKGWNPSRSCNCGKCNNQTAEYLVQFTANIAIPTGGTAGAISTAITIDGITIPGSVMTVTPAAVDEFFNVAKIIDADILTGCCQSIAVRNTSDQPITMNNAFLVISRPDLNMTY
jgi:hypothetical protein